ncbi:MAG: HNH endonuclease signature motif containing protein [Bdellovibrionota bacterium]
MRNFFKIFGTLTFLTLFLSQGQSATFPTGPDSRLTIGTLCEHGSSLRYEEKIEYCSRSVSSSKKWDIIDRYEALGYEIRRYGRYNFKIDHLIPLCAGGSNEESNLWPQHSSVYIKTDKIEGMICQLMAKGEMLQEEAVRLILDVKSNLETANDVELDLSERLSELKGLSLQKH